MPFTQRAVSQDGGITFRLKNYTIFAAVARREDLWEAATSRSRWALNAMADSILTKSIVSGEIETFFFDFVFLILLPVTAKLQARPVKP